MDNQNTSASLQSNNGPSSLIQWLRILGGAFLGYLISFFLFVLNETGYLPLFGWVVSGQVELFESVFFHAFYDNLRSTVLTDGVALFVYTSLWAFIGALLMSGRRKQIKIGVIFLILYVIGGYSSYMILLMMSIPT